MENSQISHQNCRKGGRYVKIPLFTKMSLLKWVFQDGWPIKKVSQTLKIKYSTAKTLVRQYKLGKEYIRWNDYDDQGTMKELQILELKRCKYVEVEHPEDKNEQKQPQTYLLNANTSAPHKIQLPEIHTHNHPSSHKIEIISRTLNCSFQTKSNCVIK